MQKRLISMVLALSMALSAMPLPALAQSAPPDTASAAALAEENDDVTNIYTDDWSGKPVGDPFGGSKDDWSYDEASNTLTLKNGAFRLYNYSYDSYNNYIKWNVKIEAGAILKEARIGSDYEGQYTVTNAGTISGGTFYGKVTCEAGAVIGGGTFKKAVTVDAASGDVTIDGGTFEYTVFINAVDTLTINGGTFTGGTGRSVEISDATAKVVINGGSFESAIKDHNTAATITINSGLFKSLLYGAAQNCTVNGGLFTAEDTPLSPDATVNGGCFTAKRTGLVAIDASSAPVYLPVAVAADGTVTETTTGKDGSVSKTETKPDGSSVTESKTANGTTGTVKTDVNGKTEAETKISKKAVEDAKKSGEAVKVPAEVKAGEDSNSAPTVKVELPKNAGETKIEIPVEDVNSGTVAVIVHPDGTEEIVKDSKPTEDGVQLTVDGSTTIKIIDNSKNFRDTRDHWSRDEVNFVASREIFNGVGGNNFGVNQPMTRGMVNTVLARLAGIDTTPKNGQKWYEVGTAWAKANGISDGTNPEASVTREQLATLLYRFSGTPEVRGNLLFSDAHEISDYAENALIWATQNGIMNGVGNNCIAPSSDAQRAQVAAMMARFIQNAQ
mgnify:CR=1 FL=1